ncbi:hypothetical protein QKU48_gp0758 [Fadolivirus algeromassiliense]|jgi:hypothetical protein|uniref:Uncharacterized protein n=1 Tax=Fadolivirus FV1/VV64 TaxID=3070911 RepID=A0A7D3V7N4_9VIRU|nr:hypothetical protein QKU48_gp0758 [Fadolivirus algeromassiliense]QKF94216.1 hypothetical protein Fadolivirus_1_758 [Fadolivirus FV1/VV64]
MTEQVNKLKKTAEELMQEQFTLCYRTSPYSNLWKCEAGFNSVNEVDERAKQLRDKNNDVVTTFFPFNKNMPLLVQQCRIKMALTPRIDINMKNETHY